MSTLLNMNILVVFHAHGFARETGLYVHVSATHTNNVVFRADLHVLQVTTTSGGLRSLKHDS